MNDAFLLFLWVVTSKKRGFPYILKVQDLGKTIPN